MYYYQTTFLEMELMDGKSYLEVSGLGNIRVSCSAENCYHTLETTVCHCLYCAVPVFGYILPPCFFEFRYKVNNVISHFLFPPPHTL